MCLSSVLFHFNNQCLFSESPSLPRPTFSSLPVMEDGLSQWIFSSAAAFPPQGRERGPEVNIST